LTLNTSLFGVGWFIVPVLVRFCINQHTTSEVFSFADFKDMIVAKF